MVGENYVWTSRLIQTNWILSCTVTETIYTSKIMKLFWNWRDTNRSWQNGFISWTALIYSTSGALYWMKQLFIFKTNPVKNGCSLSNERFSIVPGIESVFWTQKCSQKPFSKCMLLLGFYIFLREMDQKSKFGGTIGYGNSYLELLFRQFKIFRLHAILHDAAGAVRAHSGKGPGYCYMIGRGPISLLVGHVTGLLFCFHVKIFLPCFFNSVDFWNSLSCIVLDIVLTEKVILKELGLYIDISVQGFWFCPPKSFTPKKQTTWNTVHLHGIAWSRRKLNYEKLFAVF